MQLTINSFRPLFPHKIFALTIPWLLVKSRRYPWQLSKSLTFPGFPNKWSPCEQIFGDYCSSICYMLDILPNGQPTISKQWSIWLIIQRNKCDLLVLLVKKGRAHRQMQATLISHQKMVWICYTSEILKCANNSMITCHLQSNGTVARDLDIPTQTKISIMHNFTTIRDQLK